VPGENEENHETSVRILGLPDGIGTADLPNTIADDEESSLLGCGTV
jgi:hypothetical protein